MKNWVVAGFCNKAGMRGTRDEWRGQANGSESAQSQALTHFSQKYGTSTSDWTIESCQLAKTKD